MRLDLFLKASRLVLRRTIAQELCGGGAVTVNDHPARPSRSVHIGDRIALRRRGRLLTVRVVALPTVRQVSRQESSSLYEVVSDETVSPDPSEGPTFYEEPLDRR